MVVALSVMHMSLIVAGIESEEVGWQRGHNAHVHQKSCCLTVSDKVIMQCFNCQTPGTTATVPVAD